MPKQRKGEKVIEILVSRQMVQCVKEVQHKMQEWIVELGIGIEANPSSNFLISSLKLYEKHPIFSFYNLGLTNSEAELKNCPQIPVCINTDDQGIFSTYLEKEYALLALALEKAQDENGQKKYYRTMIYRWVDNVRKMGLNLCFAERTNLQGRYVGQLEMDDYLTIERYMYREERVAMLRN